MDIYIDSVNDCMYAKIDRNIGNDVRDISELIEIQHKFISGKNKKLFFQFTDCEYINAAVAVIIGTLPEYAKQHGRKVKYIFSEEKHPVLLFMKDVGMYKYYMKKANMKYAGENAIPFNKIENEKMMESYTNLIMRLAPIKMEYEAQCILSSYIYEIYQNGLFHANSPIGVFTSGLWRPEIKEFVFSIYDMGVGIPQKIRKHIKQDISSEKCLKIAFIEGFTTDNNTGSRGLGLYRIEKFIRLNDGQMFMFTDDICCVINKQEEKRYIRLENPIKGTLIIINIIADENHIYVVGD